MEKQQTMDAVEKTLDGIETSLEKIEATAQTLERIPRVNLNGTTKSQQVIILTTVAVAGVTIGVLGNNLIRRSINKLRRKKTVETATYHGSTI